jgi:hypothetical protein
MFGSLLCLLATHWHGWLLILEERSVSHRHIALEHLACAMGYYPHLFSTQRRRECRAQLRFATTARPATLSRTTSFNHKERRETWRKNRIKNRRLGLIRGRTDAPGWR